MNGPARQNRPKIADDPAELRRRAELRLSGHQKKTSPNRTHADNERQVHELEVHQIELEMQNEELREAREALEALLEKYTDLYDFAPVGYLTLDHDGIICEANLAGASLLGIARSALINRRFGLFRAYPVVTLWPSSVMGVNLMTKCDNRISTVYYVFRDRPLGFRRFSSEGVFEQGPARAAR